jgi:hypothetical protein
LHQGDPHCTLAATHPNLRGNATTLLIRAEHEHHNIGWAVGLVRSYANVRVVNLQMRLSQPGQRRPNLIALCTVRQQQNTHSFAMAAAGFGQSRGVRHC